MGALVLPTPQFQNEPALQLVKLLASELSTTSEDNHLDRHLDRRGMIHAETQHADIRGLCYNQHIIFY